MKNIKVVEVENMATGECEEILVPEKVMFVETYNNKWVWKKYDDKGKVIFMSKVFETERIARSNYEKSCPFCNKYLGSVGIICPCEVAPKFDADYEEWRNK